MFGNRIRDVVAEAVIARIVSAHEPLQFRELVDHLAGEVGFRQFARDTRLFGIRTGHEGRERLGELADPHGLVVNCAELRVEDDLLQFRQAARQRLFAILIPEEARIGEAGAQHALIAVDDCLAAIFRFKVRDHDEARRQLAMCVMQREIFLVRAHRACQHFLWHGHELVVDKTHQRHGPFDEPRHLVQQRLVLDKRQPFRRCQRLRAFMDEVRALRRIENDFGVEELHVVIGEVLHREFRAAHEAVAARLVARLDAIHLERHDLAAENAEDRMKRAHPAQRARSPAHRFRPGEGAHNRGHDLGDDIRRRPALFLRHRDIEGALLVFLHRRFLDGGQARRAEETVNRLLRRADLGALALFLHIRRLFRQPVDDERKAARSRIGARILSLDARLLQRVGHEAHKVLARPLLHSRRDFFREEFEQQLAHAPPPAGVFSHSSAQRFASARTRPI